MVSEQRQGGQVRDCKVVHGVGMRMIINRKLNRILRIVRELWVYQWVHSRVIQTLRTAELLDSVIKISVFWGV